MAAVQVFARGGRHLLHMGGRHQKAFSDKGLAWPPSSQVLAKYTVRGCTRREAEIGYLLESGLEVADDDELDEISADLNMSCSRVSTMNGRIVCLLPGATIWLFRRGRRLLGEEALHLQGCSVPDRSIFKNNITNRQLRDLGGNASNAGCFAGAFFAMLAVVELK